jgi:hypothetical protein
MRLIFAIWLAAFWCLSSASSPPARPAALPGAQDEDPVEVLMRLRDVVRSQASRIPDHTCVETIERDHYEPRGGLPPKSCDALLARRKQANFASLLRLDSTDRLRLDVGIAGGSEIYSWAGAKRFSAREIYDFTPAGAIGTGPFASQLLSLFDSPAPRFAFDGESVEDGRRLLEYSFTRPEPESHYQVKAGEDWLVTGYTALLLLDPRTADLVRLDIRTGELPRASRLCEVDTALDYGKVAFGGPDYVIPVAARQRFILADGTEVENRATFTACRDIRSEGKVEFGAAPASLPLPHALRVAIDIAADIDCGQAAAGDRIRGRLGRTIRDPRSGVVLVPAGALLMGRLLQVKARRVPPFETSVALRWETIEVGGVQAPVALRPFRVRNRSAWIELPLLHEQDYEVYRFPGNRPAIPIGFHTEWLTV